MNLFKKKYNLICLIVLFLNSGFVIADQCPSAEIVKARRISQEYDWSIDERRSLEELLAVEKLYSIRIKNRGEFVACYYSSVNQILRLDGAALKENCLIKTISGSWQETKNGEQVCKEEDLSQCKYVIDCENAN